MWGLGMQARHEKCSRELEELEKQLSLVEEQNKVHKMKRDFRVAEYGPTQKPPKVSLLYTVWYTVIVLLIVSVVSSVIVPVFD